MPARTAWSCSKHTARLCGIGRKRALISLKIQPKWSSRLDTWSSWKPHCVVTGKSTAVRSGFREGAQCAGLLDGNACEVLTDDVVSDLLTPRFLKHLAIYAPWQAIDLHPANSVRSGVRRGNLGSPRAKFRKGFTVLAFIWGLLHLTNNACFH